MITKQDNPDPSNNFKTDQELDRLTTDRLLRYFRRVRGKAWHVPDDERKAYDEYLVKLKAHLSKRGHLKK